MTYFYDFMSNTYLVAFLGGLLAFVLANRIIPVIIYTVRAKNLMDEPGDRSMHSTKTPTLGGVGMFVAFSITLMLFGILVGLEQPDLIKLISLVLATMILLFLGVKDDLIELAAKKKFLGQFVAAGLVVFLTDIRISSFEGLLGIGELPYLVSVVFTMFVFVLVINAFNLIDGIDGLAGAIGTMASTAFGFFFLLNKEYLMLLVSFSIIGASIGFLRYNLSHKNKLFMGDSGSMFLGYLLAYQGIRFLEINLSASSSFTIENGPVMLLAILSFPLLDTLRVFVIRAKEKRSPFSADRNHIHHRLLVLGFSHKQATIMLSIVSVLAIELAYLLKDIEINLQLVTISLIIPVIYALLFNFKRSREKEITLQDIRTVDDQVKILQMDIEKYTSSLNTAHSFKETRGTEQASVNSANTRENLELAEKRIKELQDSRMHLVIAKKLEDSNKSAKTN